MSKTPFVNAVPAAARLLAGLALGAAAALPAAADPLPSPEEMWRTIERQQREIESLKRAVGETGAKLEQTDARLEAASERIEEAPAGAVRAPTWVERTHLGGYGELHYNNLEDDASDDELEQVDFHRLVLILGHDFTDRIRLFTEVELEHALVEDTADGSGPGELELEQAWVELDLGEAQRHRVRAGIDLIPVGILNLTHEPPTFFGVERNRVESEIIPTTWWEPGIGVLGEIAPGWRYHVAVHDGLDVPTAGGSAFRIRSGRQKGALADAESGAVTGQVRYLGLPGLEVGVTGQYQQDITQDALDIDATLFTAHVDWRRGPLGLRALYARWDLDEGPAGTGPATGPSPGRDEQHGWYVEPSYRIPLPAALPVPGAVGLFARYSEFNRNAGDASLDRDDQAQLDLGLSYWPHPDVVFKADYQNQIGDATFDGFNLGVGFQF